MNEIIASSDWVNDSIVKTQLRNPTQIRSDRNKRFLAENIFQMFLQFLFAARSLIFIIVSAQCRNNFRTCLDYLLS